MHRPLRPCTIPGCWRLSANGRCSIHRADERPSASRRGYGSRWRRTRADFLARHPLCADPFGRHGSRLVAASEVDHIIPHRGDPDLFWDEANLQALCKSCHSRKTMMEAGIVADA